MNILFVTSEAFPLMKTGGLGDVSNSLPNALQQQQAQVRLIMPAYREVLAQIDHFEILGWIRVSAQQEVRIIQAKHAAFEMPIWLVDCPALFGRVGNPYTHPSGHDWHDNPLRFTRFSQAAALMAIDTLQIGWRADIVHANDWQTGMVAAFLSHERQAPKRVFTIHNIAYDCHFDYGTFQSMHLPSHWWSMELGEFYDRFSMLKAGLVFSDTITTVSPRYAEEICTPEYGYGYASILRANRHKLHGIINGIDPETWNPATDMHLVSHYSYQDSTDTVFQAKDANKRALLKTLGADEAALGNGLPLIGFVGRLVFQKGIDLLLDAIEALLPEGHAQFVVIGSGEAELENRLRHLTASHPQQVFCYIGYSEPLAHQLEAGSDIFAMPSRYEPCGLNQLYSLNYGTPAVVRNTGGLADTVIDANDTTLANGTATGIVFEEATPEALQQALQRAIDLFTDGKTWSQLVHHGMLQDFSWDHSAAAYLSLYSNS